MIMSKQSPVLLYLAPWLVFVPVIGLLINLIFGGWS